MYQLYFQGKTTHCVVVGNEKNIRVSNVCRSGTYDVVRAEWLLQSIDAGRLLPWSPADVISASPATAKLLAQSFDRYGDSFTQPACLRSLRHSFNLVVSHS